MGVVCTGVRGYLARKIPTMIEAALVCLALNVYHEARDLPNEGLVTCLVVHVEC